MKLAHTLEGLERELLGASTRQDPERLDTLLDERFREFGSSGRVFSKPEIIALLHSEQPAEIRMEDLEIFALSQNSALVTYRAVTSRGVSEAVSSLRSSIWMLQSGRWQIVFHQGTRIPLGV